MKYGVIAFVFLCATACASESKEAGTAAVADEPPGLQTDRTAAPPFTSQAVTEFNEPWAMTFLPSGELLVTEKPGRLQLVSKNGSKTPVSGIPAVDYGGQGGLGDVVLHPDFASNSVVYLSYAEAGDGGTRGAAVARAVLERGGDGPALRGVTVIWRQVPKVTGRGHYGHRLAFDAEGYLYVSSGERQKFSPAQDLQQNLGKILRLNDDGSVPEDNPFFERGGVSAQVWTLGHRNPLGLAFDDKGRLWNHEMGPAGGDELNLVVRGSDYGYPTVSNGDHYDGRPIPDHPTRPEFVPPKAWWSPVISPAGLVFYSGKPFADWQGNALLGGLSSQALIRVEIDGDSAREVARYSLGKRIREVEQGPNGYVWLLEDGAPGRLLKLTPN